MTPLRVLITGATGFIGSALADALHHRGHQLVCCVHRGDTHRLPPGVATLSVDYMQDRAPGAWLPRLRDIDLVVNAVGILRETPGATFAALHHEAPTVLFAACEQAGVERVIQISALGADAAARSRYHLTKRAADAALMRTDLAWTVVRPSLVFGPVGASSRLFLGLASLPVIPLVGAVESELQPIHIDDLVALLVRLVEGNGCSGKVVAAVGPEKVTLREMLAVYRRGLGLGRPLMLPVPLALIRLGSWLGDLRGHGALSTETLDMLLRGNTAAVDATRAILGRSPRSIADFVPRDMAEPLRAQAIWSWWRPALALTLGFMWIAAGLVSWFVEGELGLGLLRRLGFTDDVAGPALASACTADVVIGLATLSRPGRPVWLAQLVLMLFYTLALTWVAPELWADPFGPLVKNLPLAAVLLGLVASEGREWTTR
jgi:uncharacterized protein YbjT (DUF2867 family)